MRPSSVVPAAALLFLCSSPLPAQAPAAATAAAVGGRGAAMVVTNAQLDALTRFEAAVLAQSQALTSARTALSTASLIAPAEIPAKAAQLATAELNLALARADAFARLQATASKLSTDQVVSLASTVARGARAGMSTSTPLSFDDHDGFTSIFDGTLAGWDGNPAVWKIVDGEIFAESTVAGGGGTFLLSKAGNMRDFELKLLVKLTGTNPGSGIMYRSIQQPRAADPWYVNGYQYDFGNRNTGQLVDQGNRSIITYAGEATQQFPGSRHVRIADLGSALALDWYKPGEWNEVHIIARGNTLVHLMNGHLISLTIDDDPVRIPEGVIGLQVEGIGQVHFKDIWLKRL